MKVVILGSGLMGSGIASRSAIAGNQTVLVDLSIDHAKEGLKSALICIQELFDYELISEEQLGKSRSLISCSNDRDAALKGVDLVIEAITENLPAKQKLFKELDSMLPSKVPILSNTSGLRITDIASLVENHPERTMTAHFWFPAHIVPLVEVVMWEKTDPQKATWVKDTLKAWGKAPVIVKRDLPGQLANRILQAVIREAINIIDIDLASPEDVDTAIKMGMGIRFPVWGALEHIDAVGLDLAASVQDTVLQEICDRKEASPSIKKMVDDGNLGYKTGSGFYDWSRKDMDALSKKRNEFIIYALKKVL